MLYPFDTKNSVTFSYLGICHMDLYFFPNHQHSLPKTGIFLCTSFQECRTFSANSTVLGKSELLVTLLSSVQLGSFKTKPSHPQQLQLFSHCLHKPYLNPTDRVVVMREDLGKVNSSFRVPSFSFITKEHLNSSKLNVVTHGLSQPKAKASPCIVYWFDMISNPLFYDLSCFNPLVYDRDKQKGSCFQM